MLFCGSSPSGPTPGRGHKPPQTASPASKLDMGAHIWQTTTLRFAGVAVPEEFTCLPDEFCGTLSGDGMEDRRCGRAGL